MLRLSDVMDNLQDLRPAVQRINRTGVQHRDSTLVATEPKSTPSIAPRPCVPIITRSNFPCCANLAMFAAAGPMRCTQMASMPCLARKLRTGAVSGNEWVAPGR